MASKKKLLQAAAGSAGGAGLDVDEVFSTYLYDGTSSALTITNGIDLSGEGGLVWLKGRSTGGAYTYGDHELFDTETEGGNAKYLNSTRSDALAAGGGSLVNGGFNSNGFSLKSGAQINNRSGDTTTSWTWRKAPKFFDIVTWTGDGTSPRNISHSLGSQPGMMIVKRTSSAEDWTVYHRSLGATKYLQLNGTQAEQTFNQIWADTEPTSTQFTVGNTARVNTSGETYVAYLFAHNNSDGEFGPDSDQDIIKFGSYTGNSNSTGPIIDLGFEPQWIVVKRTSNTGGWFVIDTMRGWTNGSTNDPFLRFDSNQQEYENSYLQPLATGFQPKTTSSAINFSGDTYIYMAIRRGPLAEPTSGTDVFATGVVQNNTGRTLTNPLGHPSDMAFTQTSSGGDWIVQSRLTGSADLKLNSTDAEVNNKGYGFANNTNYEADGTAAIGAYGWNFRRAPSYFDVVCYTGNGTAGRTVSHNLGVKPEMIWVKTRSNAVDWGVYHKDLGATKYVRLNNDFSASTNIDPWNNTEPTSSVFTVEDGTTSNSNGYTYIAYLFATVAGVSKVGSVSHSFNSTTNVDCGFSSGARFVLVKSTATGDWYVWDSLRGIVTGNDPYFTLNTSSAEVTNGDLIDPYSGGFALSPSFYTDTYIFYAIA